MVHAVKEAVRAGAMGFSSSRAGTHVTPDDTPVASRIAEWSEIDALVGAMAELDAGIFQVGPEVSSGPAQRVVPGSVAAGGAGVRAAGDVRHDFHAAGRGAEFVPVPARLSGSQHCRGRADVRPDHHQVDQRDLRAEVVSAVRCPAALEGTACPAGARTKAAHGRSCGARAACRGRGPDEAARQRVPGWRRGDHRSSQARLY